MLSDKTIQASLSENLRGGQLSLLFSHFGTIRADVASIMNELVDTCLKMFVMNLFGV